MLTIKTISIRLEDSIFEELVELFESMGQEKQTFFEKYTRTALREKSIPFIIRADIPDTHTNRNSKMEAFARLEELRKNAPEISDFEKEMGEAMNEKYGDID